MGKIYWIRQTFPDAVVIDLLESDVFFEYAASPAYLRQRFAARPPELIVVDAIQKVPALLDEVHWLIEKARLAFLMTGLRAHKLRRGHANLLAGRAWTRRRVPLSYMETGLFDLERAMRSGFLPSIFLSTHVEEEPRVIAPGVEALPWRQFVERLWAGDLGV